MVNTALNTVNFNPLNSNSQTGTVIRERTSEGFWSAMDESGRLLNATNLNNIEVADSINIDSKTAISESRLENLQILKSAAENAQSQVSEELIEQACMDALDKGKGGSFAIGDRAVNGGKIEAYKKLSPNSLTIIFSLTDKVPYTTNVDGKNKVSFEDIKLEQIANIEIPEEQFQKAVTNYLGANGFLEAAMNMAPGTSEVLDEEHKKYTTVPLLIASKDDKGNITFRFLKDSAKFTVKYTAEQLKGMGMNTKDKNDNQNKIDTAAAAQNTATASVSGNVSNPFAVAGKGLISFS